MQEGIRPVIKILSSKVIPGLEPEIPTVEINVSAIP